MRIKDFARVTGLSLPEIQDIFGSPSPYNDSRHSILSTGVNQQGDLIRGTLRLTKDGDDLIIDSIRAMDTGGGSMVIGKICQLADKYRVGITDLTPTPYPLSRYSVRVRKLGKKELIALYEKFGFVMGDDKKMHRSPQ